MATMAPDRWTDRCKGASFCQSMPDGVFGTHNPVTAGLFGFIQSRVGSVQQILNLSHRFRTEGVGEGTKLTQAAEPESDVDQMAYSDKVLAIEPNILQVRLGKGASDG